MRTVARKKSGWVKKSTHLGNAKIHGVPFCQGMKKHNMNHFSSRFSQPPNSDKTTFYYPEKWKVNLLADVFSEKALKFCPVCPVGRFLLADLFSEKAPTFLPAHQLASLNNKENENILKEKKVLQLDKSAHQNFGLSCWKAPKSGREPRESPTGQAGQNFSAFSLKSLASI